MASAAELVDLLVQKNKFTLNRMFRGHRDASWSLQPQIDRQEFVTYRKKFKWTRREHEEELLNEFRKSVLPHVSLHPQSLWEEMALAQHHGLATRLLDWTSNPLVAMYFAVRDNSNSDSAVWYYKHAGPNSTDNSNPLSIDRLVLFDPPHITERIPAQSGRFVAYPGNIETPLQKGAKLEMFVIPNKHRRNIKKQLASLGVTESTLFPGIDGTARNTNWYFSNSY